MSNWNYPWLKSEFDTLKPDSWQVWILPFYLLMIYHRIRFFFQWNEEFVFLDINSMKFNFKPSMECLVLEYFLLIIIFNCLWFFILRKFELKKNNRIVQKWKSSMKVQKNENDLCFELKKNHSIVKKKKFKKKNIFFVGVQIRITDPDVLSVRIVQILFVCALKHLNWNMRPERERVRVCDRKRANRELNSDEVNVCTRAVEIVNVSICVLFFCCCSFSELLLRCYLRSFGRFD